MKQIQFKEINLFHFWCNSPKKKKRPIILASFCTVNKRKSDKMHTTEQRCFCCLLNWLSIGPFCFKKVMRDYLIDWLEEVRKVQHQPHSSPWLRCPIFFGHSSSSSWPTGIHHLSLSVSVYKMSIPSYSSAERSTDTRELLLLQFHFWSVYSYLVFGGLFYVTKLNSHVLILIHMSFFRRQSLWGGSGGWGYYI